MRVERVWFSLVLIFFLHSEAYIRRGGKPWVDPYIWLYPYFISSFFLLRCRHQHWHWDPRWRDPYSALMRVPPLQVVSERYVVRIAVVLIGIEEDEKVRLNQGGDQPVWWKSNFSLWQAKWRMCLSNRGWSMLSCARRSRLLWRWRIGGGSKCRWWAQSTCTW